MEDTLKKIKKLTKFMRENGVITLKSAEIELSLAPQALQLKTKPDPTSAEDPKTDAPSMEEVLFWSSPGEFGLEQ